jgi:hypothetical protein
MEISKEIERIAKLTEKEIGPTEENVKQKIIVPLLVEQLGHKRENLEFEHPTNKGGRIDIYIKRFSGPDAVSKYFQDCKVIIDTKNYNENLNDHLEQIKKYTFDENALLTVIANGTEIRIYSLLKGIAFERSLLYSIKRQDLSIEYIRNVLSDLLHNDNLWNRSVFKKIGEREQQIRDAMANEERLREEYCGKIEDIDCSIEKKEEEIEELKTDRENLEKEVKAKVSEIWNSLGLPPDIFIQFPSIGTSNIPIHPEPITLHKAKHVKLQELVDSGLIKDGQTLFLYFNNRQIRDEQVQIVASSNKVKYKRDGKFYTTSDLALKLLKEHKLIGSDRTSMRGPLCWQTEDGKILNELNDRIRQKRGY